MSKHIFKVPSGRVEVGYDNAKGLMSWQYLGSGTPSFRRPFSFTIPLDEVTNGSREMAASRTIFEMSEKINEIGVVPHSVNTEIYDEILGNRPNDRTVDHDVMGPLWGIITYTDSPCGTYYVEQYRDAHSQRQGHPDDYSMPTTWYKTQQEAQKELDHATVVCPCCVSNVVPEAVTEAAEGFPACVSCNYSITAKDGQDTDNYNRETGFRKYEPLTVPPSEWMSRQEFAKAYGPVMRTKMLEFAAVLKELGYHGKLKTDHGTFRLSAEDDKGRKIEISTKHRLSSEGGGRVTLSSYICTDIPNPDPKVYMGISAYGKEASEALTLGGNGLEPTKAAAEKFVNAVRSIDANELRIVAGELDKKYQELHQENVETTRGR